MQCIITERQIKSNYLIMVIQKRTHDSQIARAKENLTLSYAGPSQRQASGTNQRIKALRQGHHKV